MANPSYLEMSPLGVLVRSTEFKLRNLYLSHVDSPASAAPNTNRSKLLGVGVDISIGLGSKTKNAAVVHDLAVYDGVGPDKKLVARAQGLRASAGNWHNSFSMVFEDERLKGSTLEIMGASIDKEGEWAIVGGTGVFAMAQGIVVRKIHDKDAAKDTVELTITGLCTKKVVPTTDLTKNGPWGGNEGFPRDTKEKPMRLESVTIRYEGLIDSFQFSYTDQSGNKQTEGPWGAGGPAGASTETIILGPSEFVKEVSGTYGSTFNTTNVKSLMLVTNVKSYGPFGNPSYDNVQGTPFRFTAEDGSAVVGFFGRSDRFLHSFGVYTL